MIKIGPPQILHEIDRAFQHLVNFVAARKARQAISAAARTARIIAQIKGIPARFRFSCMTLPALVHPHVENLFNEGPVDAPQSSLASRAVKHFVLFYTSIARATQPESQ